MTGRYPKGLFFPLGNPVLAVMVGKLYAEGDPRRDSGYTLFYVLTLGELNILPMGLSAVSALAPKQSASFLRRASLRWTGRGRRRPRPRTPPPPSR